jgi:hypothetical protein
MKDPCPCPCVQQERTTHSSKSVTCRMSRDQRIRDNWALLYAAEQATKQGSHVAVCFNLVDSFLFAGARQFGFMLRGLQELAPKLEKANIRFHFLRGDPVKTVPKLVQDLHASLLVTDMSPLRLGKEWRQGVASKVKVPFHEVDAHNVVPVRCCTLPLLGLAVLDIEPPGPENSGSIAGTPQKMVCLSGIVHAGLLT